MGKRENGFLKKKYYFRSIHVLALNACFKHTLFLEYRIYSFFDTETKKIIKEIDDFLI